MDSKYTFAYETEANASFLVASLDNSEALVQYQMRMMENNQIPNLLHARKYHQDEELRICYNVTSHLSLKQVTAGQKMKKEEFLDVLKGLAETLKELPEYQLTTQGLLLDESYIFVTPGNYHPSFVYLPLYAEDDAMESLRQFVRKIVLESRITITNDDFIQRLLDLANTPSLTPELFAKGVEALQKHNAAPVVNVPKVELAPAYVPEPQPPVFKSTVSAPAADEVLESKPERVEDKKKKTEKKKAEKERKEIKEKKEKSGTTKQSLIFTIVQAIIVLALAMAAKSGLFANEGGGLNISHLAGAMIAALGIDVVVYRELYVNNKKGKKVAKAEKKEKTGKAKKVKGEKKKNAGAATSQVTRGEGNEGQSADILPSAPVPAPAAADIPYVPVAAPVPYAPAPEEEDKTEVIDADDFVQGYLEYYENGLVMRIHIDRGVIRVGSLAQKVNHVLASHKVSKIHAEFMRQGDACFVRDLNSTNGTYINGSKQRIVSNQNVQLHNGDRVRLADIEMVFKC